MRTGPFFGTIVAAAFALLLPTASIAVGKAGTSPQPLFFWKVTGGRGTAFLFGSIHVGTPDMYPLPKKVEDAFAHSAELVEETDLKSIDPAVLHRLFESGLYPPGDSLENHVSGQVKAALLQYLHEPGHNPAAFVRLKPWLASFVLMGAAMHASGLKGKYGIDEHFLKEAETAKKPIGELETLSFQLRLFSTLPEAMQDALLRSFLREAQNAGRRLNALLAAWRSGNGREIERLIARDERGHPQLKEVYDRLLAARNLKMAAKIEDYLQEPQTTFIVVGAAHLLGKRGLVTLLRDKEYKVVRIGPA